MRRFFNFLIVLLILLDRYNYYIKEKQHLLQIFFSMKKGELVLYVYDAFLVAMGLFGLLRETSGLPLIALGMEVFLKITLIQKGGIDSLKQNFEDSSETQIFLGLLIVFLQFFYNIAESFPGRDAVEVHIKNHHGRLVGSPMRRRKVPSIL